MGLHREFRYRNPNHIWTREGQLEGPPALTRPMMWVRVPSRSPVRAADARSKSALAREAHEDVRLFRKQDAESSNLSVGSIPQ